MTDKVSAAREKAELEKLAAETEKVKLDALKLKAELEEARVKLTEAQADARKAKAEALIAEHDEQMRAISLRDRVRSEKLTILGDYYHHHYLFDAPVDSKSVYSCLATLSAWHREDPECPMNITINSPGGGVIDGFHLLDELSRYSLRGGGKHKVTITVRGEAASMAGILLQVADERVMGPRAQLLIHEISSWTQGSIGSIKDDVKRLDMLTAQVIALFLERSEGKITRKKFEASWARRDWWLSAGDALAAGFCDRIA